MEGFEEQIKVMKYQSLSFHALHGVLKARILKWFASPFSSGPHFLRTLHHEPSVLDGPAGHGSQFIWVRQGRTLVIILFRFLWLRFSFWRPWDCSFCLFCLSSDGVSWGEGLALQPMGLQRVRHDLVTEQQTSPYK